MSQISLVHYVICDCCKSIQIINDCKICDCGYYLEKITNEYPLDTISIMETYICEYSGKEYQQVINIIKLQIYYAIIKIFNNVKIIIVYPSEYDCYSDFEKIKLKNVII